MPQGYIVIQQNDDGDIFQVELYDNDQAAIERLEFLRAKDLDAHTTVWSATVRNGKTDDASRQWNYQITEW